MLALGLGMPICVILTLFYQGISLLFQYRTFFGSKAPIPISPSHGVVAAIDDDDGSWMHNGVGECGASCSSSGNHSENFSRAEAGDMDQFSRNYQFKTFHPSNHMSRSLYLPPLRLLVVGDSVARGVGQSDSCYPIMPETLGAILSKHHGGRPVFWSAFGVPGATMKWIARKVHEQTHRKREEKGGDSVSMQQFWKLFANHTENGSLSFSGGDDGDQNNNNIQSNTFQRSMQAQWIHKLEYHTRLYEANSFAGYDYIIALSGINDIKRILVPFLVNDEDHDDGKSPQNETYIGHHIRRLLTVKEWGFGGDLRRFVRDIYRVSNFHNIATQDDQQPSMESCHDHQGFNLPFIMFPCFPTKHVPAKTGVILRWIAVKSTGILDAMKRRVADENLENNIYAVPFPDERETMDYIQNVRKPGSLMEMLSEEEIMIRLTHVNGEDCRKLVHDMKQFYSTRKARQEDNMMASELFSNDAVHPNDRGYDYFGRYLGKNVIQRWKELVKDKTKHETTYRRQRKATS